MLPLLVVVISAAVSMAVQISQDTMLTSFEFISRSGIADSFCGSSTFNFSRSLCTVFCSSCTVLKSIHNTQGSSFCRCLPTVALSFPSLYLSFPSYLHTHIHTLFSYPFPLLFITNYEYSSLGYTVRSCLSILYINIIVCVS